MVLQPEHIQTRSDTMELPDMAQNLLILAAVVAVIWIMAVKLPKGNADGGGCG